MTAPFTIHDLVDAVPGWWRGVPPTALGVRRAVVERVVRDPAQVRWGDVFWSLDSTDSIAEIVEAFERGAWGAVAAQADFEPPDERWLYVIDDPRTALVQAALAHRRRVAGRVVLVAGDESVTAQAHMLRHLLHPRRTAITAHSNGATTLVDAALEWLSTPADAPCIVRTALLDDPAELERLLALDQPRDVILTRSTDAPDARLASIVETLAARLPAEGLAVLNVDQARGLHAALGSHGQRVTTGSSADADVRAERIVHREGRLSFVVDGQPYQLSVWGRHHLAAALECIAWAHRAGWSPSSIAANLATYEPLPRRCVVRRQGALTVLDDTADASLTSLRAALELLGELPVSGRRAVVCGALDGESWSAWEQARLGHELVTLAGAELLVACGAGVETLVRAAREAGLSARSVVACASPVEAAQCVARWWRPHDAVLVKGARDMALETCVRQLLQTTPVWTTAPVARAA